MKITKDEIEKLLATMNRLEATEIELDINFFDEYTVDSIDFDIWKFGQYFTTVFAIEK